ncbi:MAG TPA: chloride channel protein, partial [Aliiroseovarius sp.]|nr:chloride channel protein [Aliiroseovarius sp.]
MRGCDERPGNRTASVETLKLFLSRQVLAGRAEIRAMWRAMRDRGPGQIWFWFIALVIGIAAGFAALLFRLGISELQAFLYGIDDPRHLRSEAEAVAWYWIVLIPTLGGLVVGAVLNWFTNDGRVRSVADVIEGAAMFDGRVERRAGLGSALASFITLSVGGSSGREGPVVHLAAVMAAWVSERINASGITARDLMGCAVAAAVSASFNAPIAGAIFALEVVLRHFAVHAFAPIAIASVAGTVINRLQFGNVTEFRLVTEGSISFYVELPAFLLLGLVSGLVAVIFMKAIFWTDDAAEAFCERVRLPAILRPALAGLMLGLMAIWFPHIIGVGYETTSAALTGELLLHEAIVFAVIKTIAVAVTMGGRMGGGIFSPSLMMGALTGLAFGLMATAVFPEVSGSETLYALAGMGAVAAAVLGAPISTTLIVFELTGDWQTGIAVMAAV